MAKRIVEQLIKKGAVTRAWLGVAIQPVTDDIAGSFGLKKARGALISDVMAGSPAEKAGLRQGDILLSFDGKEVKDARQLQLAVADAPVGKQVTVEIYRDGKQQKVTVVLASSDSSAARKPRSVAPQEGWFGLTVEELPQNKRVAGLSGVIVAGVEPESVAAESGIQRGDVIVSVNQRRVTNLKEYGAAMKQAEARGSVALLVKRGGQSIYFALKIK
jgi:S1-C subfamily serine protease